MTNLHFLMAMLGAWRLTDIIRRRENGAGEPIFESIRKLFPRCQWLQTFWSCQMCISVWAGGIATLTFFYAPFAMWPFAISWAYLLVNRLIALALDPKKQGIFFEISGSGVRVDFGGFNKQESIARLRSVLDQIEPPAKQEKA